MTRKYSLIIRWSDEDQCFVAWVPELGTGVATHGSTYEEAARAGREVIESWAQVEAASESPLPDPWVVGNPEDDERVGRQLFPANPAYATQHQAPAKRAKHASA